MKIGDRRREMARKHLRWCAAAYTGDPFPLRGWRKGVLFGLSLVLAGVRWLMARVSPPEWAQTLQASNELVERHRVACEQASACLLGGDRVGYEIYTAEARALYEEHHERFGRFVQRTRKGGTPAAPTQPSTLNS